MVKYEDSNAGTAPGKGVCEGQQHCEEKQKNKGKAVAIWQPNSSSGPQNPAPGTAASSSNLSPCSEGAAQMDAESSSGSSVSPASRSGLGDDVSRGRKVADVPLQGADGQTGMHQWLQAAHEFHALGACRADERHRPLLRLNLACFGVQGRFLAHLATHFKAKELALLARCLCAPLVSIRVGKVIRQGRLLWPTCNRGYLVLAMLPCSALRLSFFGDSGTQERIVTIRRDSSSASVKLEGILEDKSRRSFIIKLPNGRHIFFWQSEKSKSYGDELLSKMRELLARRPTLAHLTGINPSRIQAFSDYLRSFLVSLSSSSAGDNSPLFAPPVVTRTSESTFVQLTPSLSPILNALLSNHSFLGASLQTKSTPTSAGPRAKVEKRSNAPVRSNPTFKASGCKDSFLKVTSTARPFSGSKDKYRRHRKGSSVHSSSAASLVSTPNTPLADSSGKSNHELASTGSLNASKTTQAFSQCSTQDGTKSSSSNERLHNLHSKLSQDVINHVNLPAVNLQSSVLSYGQRIPNVYPLTNPALSSNIRIAIFKPCSDGQNEIPKSTSAILSKSLTKPAGSNPLGHVIEADSYMLFAVNNGQPLSSSGARLTMITPSTEDTDELCSLPNVEILQVGLCRSCKANGGNFEAIVKAILGQCLDLNIPAESSKPLLKVPVVLLCNRLASGRVSDLYHFLMQKLKR